MGLKLMDFSTGAPLNGSQLMVKALGTTPNGKNPKNKGKKKQGEGNDDETAESTKAGSYCARFALLCLLRTARICY